MGKFIKGEIVVVPFPFSDLSASKKRPALVVASLTGDDVILYRAGELKPSKTQQVINKIIQIISD